MKKIIVLAAIIPFVFASCISFGGSSNEVKELKEQVAQLQKDVAELQKANGIKANHEKIDNSDKNNRTIIADKADTRTKTNKDLAIEAIKYCLKMYKPSLKYTEIRGMEKTDGTIDVIVDYNWHGSSENTYYNVSVYRDGTFRVNSSRGLEGNFPYGDRFSIE